MLRERDRDCTLYTTLLARGKTWVVYKALKRNFKINLGASLVVVTRLDRNFARKIDRKLLEKQVKTPPNTSLMPPPKNRKLLINHPGVSCRQSVRCLCFARRLPNAKRSVAAERVSGVPSLQVGLCRGLGIAVFYVKTLPLCRHVTRV